MTANKYFLGVQMTVDEIADALLDSDVSYDDTLKLIKKLDKGFEDSDFTKQVYDWAIKQQKKHDKEIREGIKNENYWVTEEDLWVKPKPKKAKSE